MRISRCALATLFFIICQIKGRYKYEIFKKLILTLLILIIVLISILFIIGYSTYASALKQKPLVDRVTEVTSKENFVKFSKMSDIYRNAVVAVEDHRFYDHGPVDFIAICRAFYINLKTKELQEGGSTITQQVAKNIVFSQEQSWTRKLGEIFAAYDLEKNYTKNQILKYMLIQHILEMAFMEFMMLAMDIMIKTQRI